MDITMEKFEQLKADYLEMIVQGTSDAGGLPPHFTIFATNKDEEKAQSIIHVPIPDSLLTEEGKESFVTTMLPQISKKIKEKFIVFAVAWASEAWLRTGEKGKEIDENWKDLPIKKEVVIVHIESIIKKECNIYEMIRNGHKVDEDGNFIDNVSLTLLPDMESMSEATGRFTDLLKSFIEEKTS
jgi:hypothetical protein